MKLSQAGPARADAAGIPVHRAREDADRSAAAPPEQHSRRAETGASPPGRAVPSDIVAALRGGGAVTLQGFTQQAQAPSLLRPGVQFVSASIAADELRGVLVARARRVRIHVWFAIVLSHLAVVAATALLWRAPPPAVARDSAAWSVLETRASSLVVRVGGDAGPSVVFVVPVGARLPNGEMLTMVDAPRGMYATERARVFLNPSAPAAPR